MIIVIFSNFFSVSWMFFFFFEIDLWSLRTLKKNRSTFVALKVYYKKSPFIQKFLESFVLVSASYCWLLNYVDGSKWIFLHDLRRRLSWKIIAIFSDVFHSAVNVNACILHMTDYYHECYLLDSKRSFRKSICCCNLKIFVNII